MLVLKLIHASKRVRSPCPRIQNEINIATMWVCGYPVSKAELHLIKPSTVPAEKCKGLKTPLNLIIQPGYFIWGKWAQLWLAAPMLAYYCYLDIKEKTSLSFETKYYNFH